MFFSLRDHFQRASKVKRHRLGRAHRKSKSAQYQARSSARLQKEQQYSSQYSSEDPHRRNKHNLTTLPPELHLNIFDDLDPVSSACLGLSSKRFYPLHTARHPKVSLYDIAPTGVPLAMYLRDWAPQDLALDWESEKLVSRDRIARHSASGSGSGSGSRSGRYRDEPPFAVADHKYLDGRYWDAREFNEGTQRWESWDAYQKQKTPRLQRRRRVKAQRDVGEERYWAAERERERQRAYESGDVYGRRAYGYNRGGDGYERYMEEPLPKLRRPKRLERHDIWAYGRRR